MLKDLHVATISVLLADSNIMNELLVSIVRVQRLPEGEQYRREEEEAGRGEGKRG